MTTQELIAVLEQLPPDLPVIASVMDGEPIKGVRVVEWYGDTGAVMIA